MPQLLVVMAYRGVQTKLPTDAATLTSLTTPLALDPIQVAVAQWRLERGDTSVRVLEDIRVRVRVEGKAMAITLMLTITLTLMLMLTLSSL